MVATVNFHILPKAIKMKNLQRGNAMTQNRLNHYPRLLIGHESGGENVDVKIRLEANIPSSLYHKAQFHVCLPVLIPPKLLDHEAQNFARLITTPG